MIDVIIVNWNAGVQLRRCVESIDSQIVSRIVVVDNGSKDNSMAFVKHLSQVEIINAKENLGFGKACNLGANNLNGDYLLFLNPDAAVFPGTLEKAFSFMQEPANSRVGICGVQLRDELGHIARSCARFPNPLRFSAHAVGLDRIFPRLGHFMNEWTHDTTQPVDHVIGAFYFVRRKLFDSLGGFDERFFVYLEDLDFSLRARHAGWLSVYLADVHAFHAGGGTSKQVKATRLFYSLRSRLLYAEKHFGLSGSIPVFSATLLIEPVSRSAWALAIRSWASMRETWQGYVMLWRWLPRWILKRSTT